MHKYIHYTDVIKYVMHGRHIFLAFPWATRLLSFYFIYFISLLLFNPKFNFLYSALCQLGLIAYKLHFPDSSEGLAELGRQWGRKGGVSLLPLESRPCLFLRGVGDRYSSSCRVTSAFPRRLSRHHTAASVRPGLPHVRDTHANGTTRSPVSCPLLSCILLPKPYRWQLVPAVSTSLCAVPACQDLCDQFYVSNLCDNST